MDRTRIVFLSAWIILGVGGSAWAQGDKEPAPQVVNPDEQAQRLSDEALDAYKAGQFAGAAKLYKQAYSLRADPALLYNLARCYEKMDRKNDALEYYRRYLVAEGTDPKLRSRAEERIALLTATIQPRKGVEGPAIPPKPEEPQRPGRTFFYTGIAMAGAGLAGVIIGAGLQGGAASIQGGLPQVQDEMDKRQSLKRSEGLGIGALVSYTLGAALLGGGGALIALGIKKDRAANVEGTKRKTSLLPGVAFLGEGQGVLYTLQGSLP